MSDSTSMLANREKIFEEWRKFQNGEEVDHTIVRDFVYRSWLRCRALHVDPYHVMHRKLPPEQIAAELERNSMLLESSKAVMEQIFSLISDSHSFISLASRDGVILHTLPGGGLVNSRGTLSKEEYIGTVGLATCLEEQKQLEIFCCGALLHGKS